MPIARDRQAAAVQFLNAQRVPDAAFLIKPEILRRIEPVGRARSRRDRPAPRAELAARARRASTGSSSRRRSTARPPTARLDFLADVRKGVWSEVYGDARPQRRRLSPQPAARLHRDARRSRQRPRRPRRRRARVLPRRAEDAGRGSEDARSARTTDRATRLHIEDVQTQIAHALDPAIQGSGRAGARRPGRRSTSSTSRSRRTRAGWITRSDPASDVTREASYQFPGFAGCCGFQENEGPVRHRGPAFRCKAKSLKMLEPRLRLLSAA